MRFGSAADQPHDLEPHRVPCEFVRVIEWSVPDDQLQAARAYTRHSN